MSSICKVILDLVVTARRAGAARRWAAAAFLAAVVLAGLGVGTAGAAHGHDSAARPGEAEARAVVRAFFQTINAHQFARTCELFSRRFYVRNHIADKKRCALGLAAGVGMGPHVFFRILGVHTTDAVTVVRALANGAPGAIVLVKEGGRLKILSVGS